ncbi:E3 ubiquitin-protein ligase RGLG2-like [Phragmites australis]|uniref:E3 ubiquitin-protein ligase RGLG2-like n=1 Tax=Phragmites australis TaxID=29695 RepID=UPI002D785512|nr:E3 ubiquitin-protein ligase RGLG2-like [Phragmites australis]
MGGSPSRSSPRDGSGHGRYGQSRSFPQTVGAPPQWGGYYGQDPNAGYYGAPQQGGGYAAPYPAPAAAPPPPPPQTAKPQLDRRYSRIADDYNSVDQVTDALAQAGLESSNLIVGIDFTKSNEWTGKFSFHGRNLHHISSTPNPYEQAISIIGRTLSKFDEDNLIPCFGFGDASTHDQDVFCFYPDERPCNGFSEALDRYKELVPHLRLAGPTSFAPIVEMAMTIVEQSGGQYHVLLIIADGQVTRSVDTASGQLSSQEQKTVDAIVKASELPLSIVLVGVGDGPWDMMKEFDDNIPARAFDNFQFVNFSEIMSKNTPQLRKEAAFALSALMEIPQQYKATVELGILGRRSFKSPDRVPLPPPTGRHDAYSYASKSFSKPTTYAQSSSSSSPYPPHYETPHSATPAAPSSTYDNQVCPICLANPKDMAFGCGHQTCCDCGQSLESCPICRTPIATRIKLY